jgi:hypothetical protein
LGDGQHGGVGLKQLFFKHGNCRWAWSFSTSLSHWPAPWSMTHFEFDQNRASFNPFDI